MNNTRRLVCSMLTATLTLVAAGTAFAQRPDLNGTFTNMSLTGLSRPEGVEPLVVNADLAQQIADGTPIAGLDPGERSMPQRQKQKTGRHRQAVSILAFVATIRFGLTRARN